MGKTSTAQLYHLNIHVTHGYTVFQTNLKQNTPTILGINV